MTVYATSRPAPTPLDPGKRLCPRCGMVRVARRTAVVCRDCRYTLTDTEVQAWAA